MGLLGSLVGSVVGGLFGGGKKAKVNQEINIGDPYAAYRDLLKGERTQGLLDALNAQISETLRSSMVQPALQERSPVIDQLLSSASLPSLAGERLLEQLLLGGAQRQARDPTDVIRAQVMDQLKNAPLPVLASIIDRMMRGRQ